MRTEVKVEAYMLTVKGPKGKTIDVERFRIVEVPTGKILEAGIMNRPDAMARALRKAARPNAAHAAKIRRRDVRKRVVRNLTAHTFLNVSEAIISDYTEASIGDTPPILSNEEHRAFEDYPLAVKAADAKIDHDVAAYFRSGCQEAPRSSTWGAR